MDSIDYYLDHRSAAGHRTRRSAIVESCANTNGVDRPGNWSPSTCLANAGLPATTQLIATLQPEGASSPRAVRRITACWEAIVARHLHVFEWQIAAARCATLRLQDGDVIWGAVFTLPLR
jgi:hypothetical protein